MVQESLCLCQLALQFTFSIPAHLLHIKYEQKNPHFRMWAFSPFSREVLMFFCLKFLFVLLERCELETILYPNKSQDSLLLPCPETLPVTFNV